MTDALDTQIRILVTELMDAAPQAPSLPEIEWREERGGEDGGRTSIDRQKLHKHRRPFRLGAAVALAATVVVVAGLLVVGGGGGAPKIPSTAGQRTGTWKLADDVLSGMWEQNT